MADIILPITVPEAYTTKVLDMINGFAEQQITLTLNDLVSGDYVFEAKKPGENNIEFGTRFIRDFMIICLKMASEKKAREEIRDLIEAINVVPEDIPEDIIT